MSLGYRFIRKAGYLLRLRLQAQPGWAWRFAMRALAWVMRLHGLTLRYEVEDKPGYFAGRLHRPVIFLLWHNRIASMPAFYQRRRRRHRLDAFVLTSAGPEGSLLAEFLGHFGFGAVRGSTSRRSSVALREMTRRLEEGHDMIITPDGPRGPRYRLQPGALYLAQKTARPLVPLQVEYSHCFRFKTWDGFALPLPFTRVKLVIAEPRRIEADCAADQLEIERQVLERTMTDSLVMDGHPDD